MSNGGQDHPFPHKTVDYLMITDWKSTKLPMSGHHRTTSQAPFIYMTFARGLMAARFGYFLCPCKFSAMNTVK